MTPERWKQAEALFHAARTRPPGERAAFLAEACRNDEALRRDVESLLNEPISAEGFVAGPALPAGAQMVADLVPGAMRATTSIGRTLGGYHLRMLLGAGGMGEVYRAHDSTLGRDVAIKILPRAFTSDPDRLARFEREARMLASLNHPHICAIYGFEEADGIRFLILELVDGKTLADRLAGAALGVSEALVLSRQIAEALEIAHDKGIVHRDLKPANIKITVDGVVKVLDFGLAKAVGGDSSAPGLTHAPVATRSGGREGVGVVLGTAAYMSPEQACGLPVDKRTDIWAFGCVLYEMLTGRVPFPGETVSETIGKVLEREPDWSALPAATPVPVRRLLLRCLTKNPKQRLRDIGDVRIEIDAIGEALPGAPEDAATQSAPAKTLTRWLPWVAVAALATGVSVWEVRRPAATPENPLADARFSRVTYWEGTEAGAEISPDGKFVAFLADHDGQFDLWWSQLGTGQLRNLTHDIDKLYAPGILRTIGFSGDGAELWFGAIGKPKMLVPHTGGTPRPFLEANAMTPSWSADGSRLVYFRQTDDGDPLYVADRTGADARPIQIKAPDARAPSGVADTVHNHNPVWSTDDQWIYFVRGFVREWNQRDEMDIWRVPPSGGSPERLTYLNTAVTFLAALDLRTVLYVAREEDGSGPWLWALDVPSKAARRVISGLEQYTSVAASRDGRRVVATRANPTASLWTVPILEDRPADESAAQPYLEQTAPATAPRFGGTSLFYLSARGTDDGLWRVNEGKPFEILKGADGPLFEPPAPSPDGRRVAVVRKRNGKHRLMVMLANGTESRTLAPSLDVYGTADWSPDSARIVTGGRDAEGLAGLFLISVDGERAGEPTRIADGVATNPVWSPDDVIMYAGPFAKGQVSLSGVRPDGTRVALPRVRVSPGGYRFLRNGTGLVYLERPESLDFSLLDLATTKSRPLTQLGNKGSIRGFDITPDGKHIVFDRTQQHSDIVLIDLPKK